MSSIEAATQDKMSTRRSAGSGEVVIYISCSMCDDDGDWSDT